MRLFARTALIAGAVLLLGACLNVETRIDLEEDLSGRMTVSYEIEPEFWELGVFDPESDVRSIPVAESDFRRAARRVDGVELVSYSRSMGEDTVEIEAELRFADLDALNAIYGPGRELIFVRDDGGQATYRQGFRSPEAYRVEDAELIESFFADYRIDFEVRLPGEISAVNMGEILDDARAARVSLDVVEFLTGSGEVTWEIRY